MRTVSLPERLQWFRSQEKRRGLPNTPLPSILPLPLLHRPDCLCCPGISLNSHRVRVFATQNTSRIQQVPFRACAPERQKGLFDFCDIPSWHRKAESCFDFSPFVSLNSIYFIA